MSTHDHIQFESSAKVDSSALEFTQEAEEARLAVNSGDNPINWVAFGYKPKTNIIQVVESGEGDIEDLAEELVDGKPMYGYLKQTYETGGNTFSKLVYITWAPEGVPTVRKGVLHTHADMMGEFLKGFQIQINAREDDDITKDIVMKKIDMSTHYADTS